jgi:hypothetical protein
MRLISTGDRTGDPNLDWRQERNLENFSSGTASKTRDRMGRPPIAPLTCRVTAVVLQCRGPAARTGWRRSSTITSICSESRALAAVMSRPAPAPPTAPVTAKDLIALLDAAGIKRAVILSPAYIFEQPSRNVEDAAPKCAPKTTGSASRSRSTQTASSDSAGSIH